MGKLVFHKSGKEIKQAIKSRIQELLLRVGNKTRCVM
jgi:hypothetical protein